MIDLQEARRKNLMRLRGEDDGGFIAYTKESIGNSPEQCWDIISIVTRKATQEVTKKDGSTYTKQVNELAYPDLVEVQEVGKKKTGKTAKKDVVIRTNIQTMREMYETRNAMNRNYTDYLNDGYIEYFKSVVEVLDGYALQVVTDMIEADGEFLDKINNVRKAAKQTA